MNNIDLVSNMVLQSNDSVKYKVLDDNTCLNLHTSKIITMCMTFRESIINVWDINDKLIWNRYRNID